MVFIPYIYIYGITTTAHSWASVSAPGWGPAADLRRGTACRGPRPPPGGRAPPLRWWRWMHSGPPRPPGWWSPPCR